MNRAAQSLGRRARGVPKNYSAEEIARRTARLKDLNKLRWPVFRCPACGGTEFGRDVTGEPPRAAKSVRCNAPWCGWHGQWPPPKKT